MLVCCKILIKVVAAPPSSHAPVFPDPAQFLRPSELCEGGTFALAGTQVKDLEQCLIYTVAMTRHLHSEAGKSVPSWSTKAGLMSSAHRN